MLKQVSLFILFFSCIMQSCSQKELWETAGDARIEGQLLYLCGKGSNAVLKGGEYKNFELTMEIKTSPGAKGVICFHTNGTMEKGYRIALNNNDEDAVWWRKTGSLESVRNLTKSFVRNNEWFSVRIVVIDKLITVDINGEPVVEYMEPARPYRTKTHKDCLLSKGTFALLNLSEEEIVCRNMEIRTPDTSDAAVRQFPAINEEEDEIIKLHQEDFPVQDYHVHLKGGLTKEYAAEQSRRLGINYAIAPNCGRGFPISNSEQVLAYLDSMRAQPFILAMQGEGREWVTTFSPEICHEFDFVFTDAMTFTDDKGRWTCLWEPEHIWMDGDEEKYMDLIVDRICSVLQEPIDVYVNPCFLPVPMDKRYDELWTEVRMNRVIDALVQSGVALEINELYQIPNKAVIMKAKAAGVKFTFGSNNITPEVSDLSYCIRMKKECGLTAGDMYKPKVKL